MPAVFGFLFAGILGSGSFRGGWRLLLEGVGGQVILVARAAGGFWYFRVKSGSQRSGRR